MGKFIIISFLSISILLPACLGAQYVWRHKACLPAVARYNHAPFTIGNKGYMVGGYAVSSGSLAEVWEYDPNTDIWTRKNDLPTARYGVTPFVINDTAYICCGEEQGGNYLTDCYRYEQASDSWTAMASFPGSPRYNSMTFTLNGKAYVGCGKGAGQNNDFYEYDPATNVWTQKASFPGIPRQNGYCATLGSLGYMGCGFGDSGVYADGYSYNPTTNTWTPIANFPGPPTDAAGQFLINDTLYIAGGEDFMIVPYSSCWRYDVASNAWVQQDGFECIAPPRFTFFGFNLGGHGYIMCGANAPRSVAYNDLLEFGPPDTTFATLVHILGNDTTYCSNFSRVLSTGDSCTIWSTGVIGPQITVNSAGSYWASFDNNGCGVAIDTIKIQQGISTTGLGNDTSYCGSFSRVLSTGIANTTWNTGVTAAQITVTTPGTFTANATNACGNVNDTIIISQSIVPQITLGGDSFICDGQTIILNATGSGTTNSYRWQDNSTAPTYATSAAGNYSVTVTNTSGCSAIASVNVLDSLPAPKVDLGGNIKVCGGGVTTLNVPIANASFIWNDGSTDSLYKVTASGTYSVTVTNGCSSASSEVNVSVYSDDCRILVPTAFSPNQDGMNDVFHAISHCPVSGFSMHIYDRWGEQVFSSTNIQNGWDGTYKTFNAPLAVYVYYIEYMNYCEGKTEQMKGNITLVR